jgi:flagellar motor protein MotB
MMNLQHFTKLLGAACLATVISSCVTPEQQADTEHAAKHWQKQYLAADKERGDLASENAKLRAQLDASNAHPINAGGNLAEIDSRLAALNNKLAELGAAPGDVTKFAVDGGNLYQVKDAILFAPGSASLSPEGKQVLESVLADIEKSPHGQVSVRGHTDNVPVGKPETKARYPHGNLQLSAARAVEVAAVMQGAVQDLVVMGFGESRPVMPNDSDGNRQKNRRVEIFVADATAEQK